MNYSEMSDYEINLEVALLVLKYDDLLLVPASESGDVQWGDGAKWHKFNPCNSWADAGPIISGNGISIIKDGGLFLWVATSIAYWVDGVEWQIEQDVMHSNPLRAAMIVFLMMQEGK